MKEREKKPRKILESERERQFVLAPKIHSFVSSHKARTYIRKQKGRDRFFGSKGSHFLQARGIYTVGIVCCNESG